MHCVWDGIRHVESIGVRREGEEGRYTRWRGGRVEIGRKRVGREVERKA